MISRRSFLKGGATAAIGAGAAMSLGGCSPKAKGGRPFCSGRIRRRHERRSMEREMVV